MNIASHVKPNLGNVLRQGFDATPVPNLRSCPRPFPTTLGSPLLCLQSNPGDLILITDACGSVSLKRGARPSGHVPNESAKSDECRLPMESPRDIGLPPKHHILLDHGDFRYISLLANVNELLQHLKVKNTLGMYSNSMSVQTGVPCLKKAVYKTPEGHQLTGLVSSMRA